MSKAIAKKLERGLTISKWDDISALFKFRLSLMVVISSNLAYLIAAQGQGDLITFVLLFIGGMAVTGAANGINQVLEKEYDAIMERTKYRPLAADRMKSSEAMLISGLFLVFGILALSFINPLTAFLGMLSFILYAFLYTPLKRFSTLSVAVGAIPGAFPVLIGAVAFEGTITTLGLVLFLIQFLWQFPHFWAIAFLAFEDYDKAGYKLLPKGEDGKIDKHLGIYCTIYALLIIPTVIWAYYQGVSINIVGLAIVIAMTLVYAWLGIKLQWKANRKNALALMFSSFFYLPIVLITYLIA